MKAPDFQVENHLSVALVRPLNNRAERWLAEHLCGETTWYGGALVVEPRYVGDLVAGLRRDGWEVR